MVSKIQNFPKPFGSCIRNDVDTIRKLDTPFLFDNKAKTSSKIKKSMTSNSSLSSKLSKSLNALTISTNSHTIQPNGIREKIYIKFENDSNTYSLKLSLSLPYSTLLKEIKKLKPIDTFTYNYFLMKNHVLIPQKETIEESGIRVNDTIYVFLIKKEKYEEEPHGNDIVLPTKELAPPEMLPILSKAGYSIIPSLISINRMSVDELKNVSNFSIYNSFGKIEYEEPVNLCYVNLDDIFTIEMGSVSVYGNKTFKPLNGEQFNKRATVYLYELFPIGNINETDFILKLQQKCKQFNGEFKGYNSKKGIFIFQVEHF